MVLAHLCQHDDLLAREVKLLDRFAEDALRVAVRVDVGGIEGAVRRRQL